MAEINIEKKKNKGNKNRWLWIIGILILIGIIWWIIAASGEEELEYEDEVIEQGVSGKLPTEPAEELSWFAGSFPAA